MTVRRATIARGASGTALTRRSPLQSTSDRRGNTHDLALEAPTRRLTGVPAILATSLTAGLSLYALYWVIGIVQPQIYRVSFLLITLLLTFIVFPALPRWRGRVMWLDWTLAATAVIALTWPIIDFVELMGTLIALSPKTPLTARVSDLSFMGVEVP